MSVLMIQSLMLKGEIARSSRMVQKDEDSVCLFRKDTVSACSEMEEQREDPQASMSRAHTSARGHVSVTGREMITSSQLVQRQDIYRRTNDPQVRRITGPAHLRDEHHVTKNRTAAAVTGGDR
ncbi:uncharacterized protein LOC143518945 isoform X1 [Brachyhypopomus gauderio]|uniref:uncharacterized protein LOC143518945 isoform X1 n=1 Tax=Brachyhypopomus gauderio TaxID=698409 RepID=UPI0040435E52